MTSGNTVILKFCKCLKKIRYNKWNSAKIIKETNNIFLPEHMKPTHELIFKERNPSQNSHLG